MANYRVVQSDRVYDGKVFNLIVDRVEYDSGQSGIREVAEHPGGAVAIPFVDDKHVLLVRQFRHPAQKYLHELPAGKLDRGENPLHCVRRELEEETGYAAASVEHLASIYTTPGFCSEILHLYICTKLTPIDGGQRLELGESSLTVESIPFTHALAMIDSGEIVDGKTICGLLMAQRRQSRI